MKVRTVTPMSEMIDVFVRYERLGEALEALREKIVHCECEVPGEWFDARHHVRKLEQDLDSVRQILKLYEMGERQRKQKEDEPPKPPPPFKPKIVA